jgi:hypothetical protein
MAQVMPLAESRERAEQAYVACLPWSKVAHRLGYRSVGAAQSAVARYAARNPLPSAQGAADEIVARKRHTVGIATSSLAAAHKKGDHRAVAALVDAITRADAEYARLFGLGSNEVNVNVKVHQSPSEIIEAATLQLLQVVDAEVIEQREITR